MPLVTTHELHASLKLNPLGTAGLQLSKGLMKWLKLDELNEVYAQFEHLSGIAFIDAVLNELGISVHLDPLELNRIPKNRSLILIANHPLGGIDGLILLRLLLTLHPDAKVVANFLLSRIEPVRDHLCLVNPFHKSVSQRSSLSGMRSIIQMLDSEVPIGIFPAGEVSARHPSKKMRIEDREWSESILKLLYRTNATIVPIYFHARHSPMFYFLSAINPILRTARLPHEMLKGNGKTICVRIAHPVDFIDRKHFGDPFSFGLYLRRKVYQLSLALVKEQKDMFRQKTGYKAIAPQASQILLLNEIESARTSSLLTQSGDYELYHLRLRSDSIILHELGRLREITFREVREGSGKSLDIDDYDHYYEHLVLWHTTHQEIVGSYRIGKGSDILKRGGVEGFYSSESFKYSADMIPFLSQSIELGRAFITLAYQQKPLPLFLLWKGIAAISQSHLPCQYLIGSVSISNQYCLYSRSMIVNYLKEYHFDPSLACFVQAKRLFAPTFRSSSEPKICNLKALDKVINEIELRNKKVPVLIKKYLSLDAKMIGFNVDVHFSHSIDCLLYIRLSDIDMQKYAL